jgi:hypothetical protein
MMIPWRADGLARQGTGVAGLAPATFAPDVSVAAVIPATIDPAGMRMGWTFVDSGNPDVSVAVPAVVTRVPSPVAMLGRRWRDTLIDACGWTYADDYLALRNACGEKCGTGYSREEVLHVRSP